MMKAKKTGLFESTVNMFKCFVVVLETGLL